jgi:hypothetical protein
MERNGRRVYLGFHAATADRRVLGRGGGNLSKREACK